MEFTKKVPKKTIFVIDNSPSMFYEGGWRMKASKEAVIDLVNSAYDENDQAALLVFDGSARLLIPFTACTTQAKDRIENAVRGIESGDGTNYHAAISEAVRAFGEPVPGFKNLINFTTDGEDFGQSHYNTPDPILVCNEARSKGISIYCGALGMQPGYRDKLIAMSSSQFAPCDNAQKLLEFYQGVDAQVSLAGVTNTKVVLAPTSLGTVELFHGVSKGDDGNNIDPDNTGKIVTLGDLTSEDSFGCYACLSVVQPVDIDKDLKPKEGETKPAKDSVRKAFGYVEVYGDVASLGLVNHKIAEEPISVKFAINESGNPNESVVTFVQTARMVRAAAHGHQAEAASAASKAEQTQAFSADRVAQAMARKMKAMNNLQGDELKAAQQGATQAFDPAKIAAAKKRAAQAKK